MLIGVLTYNIPHRKTYDTLCLLKARGYKDVIVFGTSLHYKKRFKPLYEHRPQLINQIFSIEEFCKNLNYKYKLIDSFLEIDLKEDTRILVCGAGLLPDSFVKKYKVINSHPGYIPEVRGLDSLKWAIILKKKIGVTTHLIGDEVDAGYIIEQKEVPVYENDTFHAIEKSDGNLIYKSGENTEVHTRMQKEIEVELLQKFEEIKVKSIGERND